LNLWYVAKLAPLYVSVDGVKLGETKPVPSPSAGTTVLLGVVVSGLATVF